MKKLCLLLCLSLSIVFSTSYCEGHLREETVLAPSNFVFDGNTDEWSEVNSLIPYLEEHDKKVKTLQPRENLVSTPEAARAGDFIFLLRGHEPDARSGAVWFGQTHEGLVVAGRIYGPPPKWPSNSNFSNNDHIVVWLSDTRALELPPIGWGHQFGYEYIFSEEDCSKRTSKRTDKTDIDIQSACTQWYKDQLVYRKNLEKLFVRRWAASPDRVKETYATSEFHELAQKLRDKLILLRPNVNPQLKVHEKNTGGIAYTFEFLIPWEAFPPIKFGNIETVKLLVEVFSPKTDKSKYAPVSITPFHKRYSFAGQTSPASLKEYRLVKPMEFYITPCKYGIEDIHTRQKLSERFKVYILPSRHRDLRTLLVLENEARGYQYEPDNTSHSPIVIKTEFFVKDLGEGEVLCGPQLRYFQDYSIHKSDNIIDSVEYLDTKRLPDDNLLVKDGPRQWHSFYGSGQCGACPRMKINIYYINMDTGWIVQALSYTGIIEAGRNDIRISVSNDWRTVGIFECQTDYSEKMPAGRWNNIKTFCFDENTRTYQICHEADISEPSDECWPPTVG